MHQLVEAVFIALQAIWANKLRSFMTVLGNIVAVMSIVTVVSLITGMDTYVGDAIVSGVGADGFTVERTGITTTQEEIDQDRNNPRITTKEAEYIRQFSPLYRLWSREHSHEERLRTIKQYLNKLKLLV